MTTELNNAIIQEAMAAFFRQEVITWAGYGLLALVAVVIAVIIYKKALCGSRTESIVAIVAACVCAVGLSILAIVEFIPVCQDYTEMSYTICENAEVLIVEGTNNLWEQENEVRVLTQDGKELQLAITHDYHFETGVPLKGTVVYTDHTKHIIWYELSPSTPEHQQKGE